MVVQNLNLKKNSNGWYDKTTIIELPYHRRIKVTNYTDLKKEQ